MDLQKFRPETETKSMHWLVPLIFSILISSLFSSVSFAQMDSMLLRGSKEPPQDAGVSSGRYEVRELAPGQAPIPVIHKPASNLKSSASGATANRKGNKRRVSNETEKPGADSILESTAKPVAPTVNADPPSLPDQIKDLVLGNEPSSLEAYKDQIHPDDVRLNRLEINVSPGLLSHDSKSTYSFRNYQSYSPYVAVGAQIWLTPFLGINGKYGTSLGSDIGETASATTHIPVTHEISEISWDFRKFFGTSRKSNSMTFGIFYSEYKFSVPGDNLKRVKTKSTGIGIQFESRFPVAPSYAWILGGKIEPRISHTELATGLNLTSGASPQSSKVGLNIGGELKLSRLDQIIWGLSYSIEKNQFSGAASLQDPESSQTPTGVSVTNTQSIFTLGYRWGH